MISREKKGRNTETEEKSLWLFEGEEENPRGEKFKANGEAQQVN